MSIKQFPDKMFDHDDDDDGDDNDSNNKIAF